MTSRRQRFTVALMQHGKHLWSNKRTQEAEIQKSLKSTSQGDNKRLKCFTKRMIESSMDAFLSLMQQKKTDFPRPSSGVLPWIYFLFAQILNFSLWNLKRLFLWLERSSKEKLLCDLREFSKVSGTVFMESLQTSPALRMPQTDFFFYFRQNWNDLVYRSQRNGNKSLVPSAMTLSRNTWALKQTVRFYTTGSIKRGRQAGKTKNFTDQKLHSINPKGRIQNRQQKKREVTRN